MTVRIAPRFRRVEPRRRGRGYLLGLLSPPPGKNNWTIAEAAGDDTQDGMQRLLNDYQWDDDAVRDDLRGYVAEHLAADDGVLIVDDPLSIVVQLSVWCRCPSSRAPALPANATATASTTRCNAGVRR
jgi:hypothetical protein